VTDEAQTTVAILDKNRDKQVRVLLGTFKGRRLCHVRIFLKRLDGVDRDPPLPTKKGITVAADKVPEIIEALKQVCILEGIANAA
jgi:hypothetical protein